MRLIPISGALIATTLLAGPSYADPVVKLSGFIDSSISYKFTPEAESKKGVSLGLDQVELDIDVAVTDGLQVRTDLNLFPAEAAGLNGFDRIVEQAFFEWYCGGDKGLFLRGGKWNAPIGFEVADPTGLWQYSQGLLFTRATPTNLTGFALGWAGESTTVQLWVTNDWDTPSTPKDASVGGRVQQSLGDTGTIGLSTTYGAFVDDPAKLMVDLDAALTFGDLKLGAQFNFGKQDDLQSLGFLIAGNYTFSDVVSATVRFDWLDREIMDLPYKGMSITGAGLFNITSGLGLIAEVRADMPDGGDTTVGGALELLATY